MVPPWSAGKEINPLRIQLPDLPRWDLSTVYPDLASPAFRNDLDALTRLMADLESFGSLPFRADDSATAFDRILTCYDTALLTAWKLDSYVAALLDTGTADPLARTTEGEMQTILAGLTILGQRFAAWIARL